MNIDDIKDQIQERWEILRNRIMEDPSVNSLKERFETLPSSAQKGIISGALFLLVLVIIYIPYGYFQSAREYEEKYSSNRSTIRELLKVGKADSSRALFTQRGNTDLLKSRISSILNNFNLMGDQIQGVEILTESQSSLARPPVQEDVFQVKLKKLNLDQILQVGSDLARSFGDLKMTGLIISEDSEKKGYFNTEFRLSKFYLPDADSASSDDKADNKADKKPDSQRKRRFQRK